MNLNTQLNKLLEKFEYAQVVSSNVKNIGYDKSTSTLEVTFKSDARYEYSNVAYKLYVAFKKASSKGKFGNKYVFHNYEYEKIN